MDAKRFKLLVDIIMAQIDTILNAVAQDILKSVSGKIERLT